MYDTLEIRWILPGSMPAAVARWFRFRGNDHDRHDIEPELRTDCYVVLHGCESVGIKVRGVDRDDPPRVDVKARIGNATELRLGPDVIGQVAAWSKWTLTLTDLGAIASGLEPPTPMVTTHKRRLLRRFVVEDDRTREVAADEVVDGGCDIELTSISLDGVDDPWWSLGLEAFGPGERARDTLWAVGRHWFAAHGAPPLSSARSFDGDSSTAYPAWLSKRLAEAGRRDRPEPG